MANIRVKPHVDLISNQGIKIKINFKDESLFLFANAYTKSLKMW